MMPGRPRVAILGAGAMGTLFGYHLARHTSAEVWLLARTPRPARAAVEEEDEVPVAVGFPPVPADLLLVLVKAYDTAAAIRWAAAAVGPATLVLTLQNGLGNAEALAGVVRPERLLVGTTANGATLLEPGRVRRGGSGPTRIAPWRADHAAQAGGPAGLAAEGGAGGTAGPAVEAVAALLTAARLPTTAEPDPLALLWSKLAVNAGINALTAVLDVPNGELLNRPAACRLMERATEEAAAVAAALGIALNEDPVAGVRAVALATASNRSSMRQDVTAGRRTEVEAINGAVVAAGQATGVPTPVNAALTALVLALAPA